MPPELFFSGLVFISEFEVALTSEHRSIRNLFEFAMGWSKFRESFSPFLVKPAPKPLKNLFFGLSTHHKTVETIGLEPTTLALQRRCSPN
jgi:hypothetical protein